MTWETVLVRQNPVIGCLDILRFVWRFAYQNRIQNNPDRPNINFKRMTPFGFIALNNFRRNVIGCSTDRLSLFILVFDTRGETEITNFDVHILVEKEIAEFEIAVNDMGFVHVTSRMNQLLQEIGCFRFCESFSPFDHFIETLIVTQLEQDVAIVAIFKVVFVLTNVFVFECAMNLDLGLQLSL